MCVDVGMLCLQLQRGGVYGEDENRFVFMNTLVGTKARARFKIANNNKVCQRRMALLHQLGLTTTNSCCV